MIRTICLGLVLLTGFTSTGCCFRRCCRPICRPACASDCCNTSCGYTSGPPPFAGPVHAAPMPIYGAPPAPLAK